MSCSPKIRPPLEVLFLHPSLPSPLTPVTLPEVPTATQVYPQAPQSVIHFDQLYGMLCGWDLTLLEGNAFLEPREKAAPRGLRKH